MLDPHPTAQAEIRSVRPPGDFEAAVAAATERIDGRGDEQGRARPRGGRQRRRRPTTRPPLFGAMREQFPSCFCFCCGTPEAAFLGASPELLVRRSGRERLDRRARRLDPAQLRPRRRRPPRRAAAAQRQGPPRAADRRRAHRPRPAPARGLGRGRAPSRRSIKVANIQHLATPVIAQLAEPRSAIELAGLLHPTPAVGGEPWPAAASGDRRARADGPRLVRRPGRLDGRDRGRRVLRRPAQRPAARPRGPPLRRRRRRRRLRPRGRAGRDRDQAQALLPLLARSSRRPQPSTAWTEAAVELDVGRDHRDLDQAGAGGEGLGQLGERLEAAVGEVEEGGCLGDVDAARGAEQRLELVARPGPPPAAGSGRCRRRRCR